MGDRIRDSLGCLYGSLKVPVSELTGKTIIKLEQADNWRELRLFCSDGTAYAFYSPRCQERKSFLGEGKYLEDVKGDLGWLLEAKVLEAGKADTESGIHEGRWDTFYEWEIYRLITEKGQVELRFLGVSDGWDPMYMEFIRIPQGDFWDAAWRGEETEGADVRTGAGEEAKAGAEANGETGIWCGTREGGPSSWPGSDSGAV